MQGKAEIGLKVGEVLHRHKMAKHFELTIGDASFGFRRKAEAIAAEAALDGLYVVRTNLPAEVIIVLLLVSGMVVANVAHWGGRNEGSALFFP